ncbi:MAG: hypothetical protein R3C59_02585 [Planctomycetaceae bacterium]
MVLCAALIATRSPLGAQDSEPLLIEPVIPQASELLPLDESDYLRSASETGFWFLNTHHSPQSFDAPGPRFCPGVSRFECGRGFQPSGFQTLRDSLEPGVPVCIMVHGSFVDTPSFCRESQQTWHWLESASHGQPMQMIYFHWPSYRMLTPLVAFDVNILGRRAARNGYYLAELIQHLPPESPVCLIGHSHGTRVIASCLHLLAGGAVQGVCHPYARVNGRSIRTVFTGSAIDHHWLNPGQRYDRALCSTECLLNMTNCKDPALWTYPFRLPLLVRPALGKTGLTAGDRRRLGPMGNRVYDYDVSQAIGASHLWPYYFQQPGLAMAIRNYVYFPDRISQLTIVEDSQHSLR